MKVKEVFMVRYKDDITFSERLTTAEKLIYRYRIFEPNGAKELLSDHNIPCEVEYVPNLDENREVQYYLKIPFYA